MANLENESFFNKIKNSIPTTLPVVKFINWQGCYALFSIQSHAPQHGINIQRVIVSQEGDWIGEDAMMCYPQYARYEDVQYDLGDGLFLLRKWLSPEKRKSYFEYEILKNNSVLAVPATGEEMDFEIYGLGPNNNKFLLIKREL